MRFFTITLLALVVVALSTACRRHNLPVEDDTTLKIGILARSVPSTPNLDGTLGQAEYSIKSLRVFAFESSGELDMTEYVEYPSAVTYSVVHDFNVKKADEKILYIIVNEPEGLFEDVSSITSQSQLTNLNFRIADNLNSGFNAAATFSQGDFLIPMTAVSTVDASSSCEIQIGVDRAVARVDFMLDKGVNSAGKEVKLTSASTFTIDGVELDSRLFVGATLPVVTAQDIESQSSVTSSEVTIKGHADDKSTSTRVLSFYMAEREYDADNSDTQIKIKLNNIFVDGTAIAIENAIVLGQNSSSPLTAINRNTIYKIYATYNGIKDIVVDDEFTIVDWVDVEVDGEIEGVMFVVDRTLVADWLRNGNSFTSPISSFGSNKPVEVYLPVVDGQNSDGTINYRFELYEFPEVAAGKEYDLKSIALEDNFINKTTWIDEAKLVFTSQTTGYVKIVYSTANTTYDRQSYPIRFKSDNVVKEMKVIYDNGYIPVEFLPEHWKERAPGGVVFAKRGVTQHPRDVVDIFYRDSDGYYRGDATMTQAQTDDYCKQLGELWYLPSVEDMEAMIPGVKELGTSYRFQDTGSALGQSPTDAYYWTSSESLTAVGSYWCGNFIFNNSPIVDVYDWITERNGSETNYVRCALDIK